MVELDHVLIAVRDLVEAGQDLEARYGLGSIDGGSHPGWGTANRIVPLGASYIELIGVVDQTEAAASPFGRWVAQAELGRPLGWAVRTHELETVARRLGLSVDVGSRVTPDGTFLRWRSAGKREAIGEPSLPFFIEWNSLTAHPGRAGAATATFDRLVLHGDADRIRAWLGDHSLPIVVRSGTPAVASVVLSGREGEVTL